MGVQHLAVQDRAAAAADRMPHRVTEEAVAAIHDKALVLLLAAAQIL